MKTEELIQAVAALAFKQRLQHQYEEAYPQLRDIIHLVVEEEDAHAKELSEFPLLLLPDLVDAHIQTLGLEPVSTIHEDVSAAPICLTQLAAAMA